MNKFLILALVIGLAAVVSGAGSKKAGEACTASGGGGAAPAAAGGEAAPEGRRRREDKEVAGLPSGDGDMVGPGVVLVRHKRGANDDCAAGFVCKGGVCVSGAGSLVLQASIVLSALAAHLFH